MVRGGGEGRGGRHCNEVAIVVVSGGAGCDSPSPPPSLLWPSLLVLRDGARAAPDPMFIFA